MLLELDGLPRPIAFVGCDDVARHLRRVMRGCRMREDGTRSLYALLITVEKSPRGFRLASPWRARPAGYDNRVDTVCGIIVDLIKGVIAAEPSLLCLHCAAVEFNRRLVVFPSHYKAGKSLLAVGLAAAGLRIFADDVLPIDGCGNRGVAPGFLPRLRLPLPDDSDRALTDYVDEYATLRNRRYLYVDVGDAGLAPRGATAPIGAFVLLRREDGAKASLTPVKQSEMLKRVVLRNFAHDVRSAELVERLHGLVATAGCYRLRYSHLGDAVDLLERAFDDWPEPQAARPVTSTTGPVTGRRGRLARTAGITERRVDDEMFLIDGHGEAIYHLNATSAAIWRLLAEPMNRKAVVEALRRAFPDVAARRIGRDVGAVLDDLTKRRLIGGGPALKKRR